jgi:hypothetical protein
MPSRDLPSAIVISRIEDTEEPMRRLVLATQTRRIVLPILGAVALLILAAQPALAAINTTFNPAAAPTGTHVQTGSPSCSVSGLTVNCSTYELAGVGNANATGSLVANYTGTVVCRNAGGNLSDGQHQGTFTASSTTGSLSPKNGRLTVPALSSTPPTPAQFIAQQTCPNPNWTPELQGPITLSSFTYTLHFAGFTGDFITITGP